METQLVTRKCQACEGGILPLKGDAIAKFMEQVSDEWELVDEKKIRREFKFKDFVAAMAFANKVADLAEAEGHHPDLHVAWGKVVVELWTHKIDGLWDNDFIMAAKIDREVEI